MHPSSLSDAICFNGFTSKEKGHPASGWPNSVQRSLLSDYFFASAVFASAVFAAAVFAVAFASVALAAVAFVSAAMLASAPFAASTFVVASLVVPAVAFASVTGAVTFASVVFVAAPSFLHAASERPATATRVTIANFFMSTTPSSKKMIWTGSAQSPKS